MMQTPRESTWLGHPPGLFVLFATEMWERFSYYGMRALLILYLTKHWLYADGEAAMIYGSYAAMVYAVPVLGGMIADRYLGLRKAIIFGAVLLVAGHLGMAYEGPPAVVIGETVERSAQHEQAFYLALSFIIVGVGFLKANISTIVGGLYGEGDPRRDGGFTIFYMGINLGAFVATLLCAYLGETYGWRYGFGLAGIGMVIGLLTFLLGSKYLAGLGLPPAPAALAARRFGVSMEHRIYASAVVFVGLIWFAIQNTQEMGVVLTLFTSVITAYVIWFSITECTPQERDRMLSMLLLMFLSVVFWALFEQAGSSLTLFTDRNVDRGDFFTAGMFGSLNSLFIIMFAPIFALLWVMMARVQREPSTPMKFGVAILLVGLGFYALVLGAAYAGPNGQVAVVWLVLMYWLHTMGELCLSPVGLSMVTKLSVQRVAAMMMGVWFLSSAFAAYVGGWIASLMAIEGAGGDVPGTASLAVYVTVFEKLGLLAVIMGIGLMLVAPIIAKRMR
jgi:proton-dependent oligopeptide transporter, POT family